MQEKVKAVIFDWAGTIIDFGCMAPVDALIELFRKRNIILSVNDARKNMGMEKKAHLSSLLETEIIINQWMAVYNNKPGNDDLEALYAEFEPSLISSVKKFSKPIPGVLELFAELRKRKIAIGTTTGYPDNIMKELIPVAQKHGLVPDSIVNSSEVTAGRPYPWMCYLNAMRLGVYPMWQMVKIGDTLADIYEGLNAGMWTIGIILSGNEVGLTEDEMEKTNKDEIRRLQLMAQQKMKKAGAHYIANDISECEDIIYEIGQRISKGERPL